MLQALFQEAQPHLFFAIFAWDGGGTALSDALSLHLLLVQLKYLQPVLHSCSSVLTGSSETESRLCSPQLWFRWSHHTLAKCDRLVSGQRPNNRVTSKQTTFAFHSGAFCPAFSLFQAALQSEKCLLGLGKQHLGSSLLEFIRNTLCSQKLLLSKEFLFSLWTTLETIFLSWMDQHSCSHTFRVPPKLWPAQNYVMTKADSLVTL